MREPTFSLMLDNLVSLKMIYITFYLSNTILNNKPHHFHRKAKHKSNNETEETEGLIWAPRAQNCGQIYICMLLGD